MKATYPKNFFGSRRDSKTVRLAASLFFFVCVPMSLWDQFYVPGKIFVSRDPVVQKPLYLYIRSFLMYTTLAYAAALLWFLVKGVKQPDTNHHQLIQ